MTEQENLFKNIADMKYEMQNLAGHIQNDFTKLLADGKITTQQIEIGINDMYDDFKRVIGELHGLSNQCAWLMEYTIKDN